MSRVNTRAFLSITANVDTTRVRVLEGQNRVVAPAVMLVEGVHCGVGPDGKTTCLRYTSDLLANMPSLWNGMPVVLGHPFNAEGKPGSARTPEFLEGAGVGRLFNADYRFAGKKLVAEAFIDEPRLRALSPLAATAMRNGKPLEVSAGFLFIHDETPGTWNGERYDATVTALMPDHLALLPGDTGACSVRDGCGLNVNKSINDERGGTMEHVTIEFEESQFPWIEKAKMVGLAAIRRFISLFDVSHEDVRRNLQREVDKLDGGGWAHYVVEVHDAYLIFRAENNMPVGGGVKYYKQGFRNAADGASLTGDRQEVVKFTEWRPAPQRAAASEGKETDVDKQAERVAALIASDVTTFTDDHKEWLLSMSDCQLSALESVEKIAGEKSKTVAPVANAESPGDVAKVTVASAPDGKLAADKPQTAEEYIAEAPTEIRGALKSMQERHDVEHARFVMELVANEKCGFSKDELEAKDVAELEKIANMVRVEKKPDDFSGSGGGQTQVNADGDDGGDLPLPQMSPREKAETTKPKVATTA